jgi:hypothetical protein
MVQAAQAGIREQRKQPGLGVRYSGIVTGNDTGGWSRQVQECLAGSLSLGCIRFVFSPANGGKARLGQLN